MKCGRHPTSTLQHSIGEEVYLWYNMKTGMSLEVFQRLLRHITDIFATRKRYWDDSCEQKNQGNQIDTGNRTIKNEDKTQHIRLYDVNLPRREVPTHQLYGVRRTRW